MLPRGRGGEEKSVEGGRGKGKCTISEVLEGGVVLPFQVFLLFGGLPSTPPHH